MRCLFLYNPNSGKGKIKRKIPLIRKMLSQKYEEVVLHATSSAEDLTAQAREGADRFDAIVFAGGDGSFNLILQGIGERNIQLGYVPSGTANDVAHSLGIPKRVKGALNVILKGRSEQLDCMRINGKHYAMYVAAAGAFTHVTYDTPQKKKRRFGWAAYCAEALKDMNFDSFPVKMRSPNGSLNAEGVLILVMNGRSVAGFPVNKSASMQDGVMETAVVTGKAGKRGRLGALLSIVHLFLFGHRVKKKSLVFLSGSELEIEADEKIVWDFDGERGVCGNVKIELLPRRVKLFVPAKKKI